MTRAALSVPKLLENCDSCTLNSGYKTLLPWASGSASIIPFDVRNDIKEADGWKVLYSTIDIIGYNRRKNPADSKANYLLLYNRYTGILKGFVYLNTGEYKNNNAFWVLNIPQKTSLFNFTGEFAEPSNSVEAPHTVVLSNITTNTFTHGFENGWNCFMVELAYDKNSMAESLDISA